MVFTIYYVLKDSIYLFLERREWKEKERVASHVPASGNLPHNLAHSPGMWPDWELNRWPFGFQYDVQPTELHQSGLWFIMISMLVPNKSAFVLNIGNIKEITVKSRLIKL